MAMRLSAPWKSASVASMLPAPVRSTPPCSYSKTWGMSTVSEQDGKKVYTITPAGRQFLAERAEVLNDIQARFQGWWGAPADPDLRAVWRDLKEEIAGFGRLFAASATIAHQPAKLRQLVTVLREARQRIEAIVEGRGADNAVSCSSPMERGRRFGCWLRGP
ncbi:MAG: hypothetical protein KatS3mg061_3577 [Dehalococcoidia bacterium]|nr:MAG: hypothetical protein KatS3mg061_3577 [Dehalococcoidia bacterium]